MGLAQKIGQKGLILVALPSLFEIVFVLILTTLLNQAEREAAREARSKAIIACANALTRATVDATTAAGAFRISHQPLFSQRADLALESAKVQGDKLRNLLKDNPKRLRDLDSVRALIKELIKVVAVLKEDSGDDEVPSLVSLVGRGRQFTSINRLVNQLGVTTNLLIADELKIELESPMQRAKTRQQIKLVLLGGTVLNIALAFALVAYFSRSVTRRLLIVRENTERLAKKQKLVEPIGGQDEIAELDSAFHDAATRLDELEQFKKQMIGIVSHELKAPLGSMQVNLALMSAGATGPLSEKSQQKIQVLESNVARLIRLINDLLDIDKLEAGRFELMLQNKDLGSIIDSSFDAVRALAEQKNIKIEKPEDLKEVVYADFDRIVQVLINLLSNAIKYSNEGASVRIFVEKAEEPGFVLIKVIDNGRGIPQEFLAKVFDRFQQVEKSDEKILKGTGLGLAICKAVIEEHGGKIGVDSKQSQETCFWFTVKEKIS